MCYIFIVIYDNLFMFTLCFGDVHKGDGFVPLYGIAVLGLVQSDLPSDDDILGFLSAKGILSGGSPFLYLISPLSDTAPRSGSNAWDCVSGVAVFHQEEAQYTTYEPSNIINVLPDTVPASVPSLPVSAAWIRARVKLGLMTRWKALYYVNGYDKAFSIL